MGSGWQKHRGESWRRTIMSHDAIQCNRRQKPLMFSISVPSHHLAWPVSGLCWNSSWNSSWQNERSLTEPKCVLFDVTFSPPFSGLFLQMITIATRIPVPSRFGECQSSGPWCNLHSSGRRSWRRDTHSWVFLPSIFSHADVLTHSSFCLIWKNQFMRHLFCCHTTKQTTHSRANETGKKVIHRVKVV